MRTHLSLHRHDVILQVLELRRIFLLLRVAFEIGLLIVLYYLIVAVIGLSSSAISGDGEGLVGAIYLLAIGKLATVTVATSYYPKGPLPQIRSATP